MMKQYFKMVMFCWTLIWVGCSGPAEYVNVIPKDASVVAVLDNKVVANKSGLFSEEPGGSKMKNSIVDKLSLSRTEVWDKFLETPSELGVDWNQKMYAFMIPETHAAFLVMSVLDPVKLQSALEVLGKKKFRGGLHEGEGYKWFQSREFCVAFNEKSCLIASLGNGERMENLKTAVASLMKQPVEQSFVSTRYYKQLADLDGDMRVFVDVPILPAYLSMLTNMIYAEEPSDNDVKFFLDLSFEQGEFVGDGQFLIEDELLLDRINKVQGVCKELDGKALKKYPASTPCWFAFGLEGDKLFDCLLESPLYGDDLKNMRLPLDIENVVRSIDGDIAIGFPHALFVDVTNKELLKVLVGTAKTLGGLIGVNLTEVGEDEYDIDLRRKNLLKWNGLKFQPRLGMDGERFYLTTDPAVLNDVDEATSLATAPWAKEVDGNLFFGAFSFEQGNQLFKEYNRYPKVERLCSSYFDYVTCSLKNIENNKIVLSFKDKKRNSLEQLLEMIMSQN